MFARVLDGPAGSGGLDLDFCCRVTVFGGICMGEVDATASSQRRPGRSYDPRIIMKHVRLQHAGRIERIPDLGNSFAAWTKRMDRPNGISNMCCTNCSIADIGPLKFRHPYRFPFRADRPRTE